MNKNMKDLLIKILVILLLIANTIICTSMLITINRMEKDHQELVLKLDSLQAALKENLDGNTAAIDMLSDKVDELSKSLDDFTAPAINLPEEETQLDTEPTKEEKAAASKPNNTTTSPKTNTTESQPATEQPVKKISAGEKFVVEISSPSLSDVYGYEFKMYFNKTQLEYKGELKSSIPDINTIFANEFEKYVIVGATKIGSQAGYTGENVKVCQLSFVALQDCEMSDVTLGAVNVVNSKNEYIEGVENWNYEVKLVQ